MTYLKDFEKVIKEYKDNNAEREFVARGIENFKKYLKRYATRKISNRELVKNVYGHNLTHKSGDDTITLSIIKGRDGEREISISYRFNGAYRSEYAHGGLTIGREYGFIDNYNETITLNTWGDLLEKWDDIEKHITKHEIKTDKELETLYTEYSKAVEQVDNIEHKLLDMGLLGLMKGQ